MELTFSQNVTIKLSEHFKVNKTKINLEMSLVL